MFRRVLLVALALVAAGVAGCAQTRSYHVAVRNETSDSITVGFAKENGGPFEAQWATPEQVAMQSPGDDGRGWDSVVVPPGKTGVAGPLQGKFDGSAVAVLRVYGASGGLNDLLAMSRDSPRRVDVPLAPGRNALIVREEAGKLKVEHVQLPEPKKS